MSDLEKMREQTSYQLRAYFPWPASIPAVIARRAADELDELENKLAEARESEKRFRKECEALAVQRSNLFKTIDSLRDEIKKTREAGGGAP